MQRLKLVSLLMLITARSTSYCINHGPSQYERAIFDHPIFMKLEIYNYIPDTTPHAQYQAVLQFTESDRI